MSQVSGGYTRALAQMPSVPMIDSYALDMPNFLAQTAQRLGPIFTSGWSPERRVVYLVGPEANKLVLQTQRDAFSHARGWTPYIGDVLGVGLLNMDDPEHGHDRKLMNPAFAAAYMERYLPIMRRVIAERTRGWAAQAAVDVYAEARKITFDVAAEALVGFHAGPDVDHLQRLFFTVIGGELGEGEAEEAYWQRMGAAQQELDAMLRTMIAERRRAIADGTVGDARGDILSLLIQARDEQGRALDDERILGHVNILLVAGHETSTTLSAWLLAELARHPAYLARVQAELDAALSDPDAPVTLDTLRALPALANALMEAGRLHPPAGNIPRGVTRDVAFGGYTIPAGAHVIYSIAAGHRLPTVFAEPERFDPDRFAPPREEDKRTPYGLVTFGGGPRICIGINFAQVEIRALVAHVLRTHTLEPVTGQEPVMVYPSPIGVIVNGAWLRVRPRSA